MDNKSSLWNVLQSVLSVGNKEANQQYAPYIFSNHYNIVTSFLLDKLSELYPKHVDVLLPFIETKKIPVTEGYIQLPTDYRNLLGAPSINAKPDGSDCNDPMVIDTAKEFKAKQLKSGCKSRPIVIKSKEEWDDLTTSTYAFPTLDNPIGLYIGNKRIKVCPYNIATVEVLYLRNEQQYSLKYVMQPDDTYLPDGDTNTEWGGNAQEFLFKGCLSLYGAYQRDPEIKDYNTILNQQGLF